MGTGNIFEHQENYPSKAFAFSNFKDLDINLGQVESQLKAGFHGIGKVSIRHFESGPSGNKGQDTAFGFDEPILIELYDLARAHMVPVLFHFDYDANSLDEMNNTLPNYLDVTFISAHSGDAQPQQLRPLLKMHDNLHLDISSRNPLVSFEDRLTSKEPQRLD